MAFLNCEVFSKTLNMATALRVILPDEGELGAANTVYLLHGLSDNSSGWTRYTAVEQYARERGLAVVMPEVQRSFYADMAAGLDYFGYVAVELPAMCERMFGLPHERTKRYVMGRLRGAEMRADVSGALCRRGQLLRRCGYPPAGVLGQDSGGRPRARGNIRRGQP